MRYHSNGELLEACEAAADAAGERAQTFTLGNTVEGRPILAVQVAAAGPPRGDGPQALLIGNVHGNEVIGSEVALAALRSLCTPRAGSRAAELLALADVTVVPAVNLDARADSLRTFARGLGGAPRRNANGVDLNRNFPFPANARDVWHPLAGTRLPWLPWYRGPEPLSEPEAQVLVSLCDELRPLAALSLHSVGRLFLYPPCYTADPPADVEAFRAMGAAFQAAQPGPRYTVKQAHSWYTVLGDLDDWLYDTHGTLACTVELSVPLAGVGLNPLRLLNQFTWMNPRSPAGPIANAADACLAALAEGCRRRLSHGSVSASPPPIGT